jgi:hypothetical protein
MCLRSTMQVGSWSSVSRESTLYSCVTDGLGLCTRYAVNLWFRPNIYVVLHQPLSRIEQHNDSMMIRLRDAAKPLASLMLQRGEAGMDKNTRTGLGPTGGGEEATYSPCSKSSDMA